MNHPLELHKTTQLLLMQLIGMLENFPDQHYRKSLEVIADASVANNVCSIISKYEHLIQGMEKGTVEYLKSEHQGEVLLKKSYAIERLRFVLHILDKWPETAKIKVVSTLGSLESCKLNAPSTYGRELLHCLEFTVHHMVVVKTGVYIQWPEVEIPRNFGMVAESYFN